MEKKRGWRNAEGAENSSVFEHHIGKAYACLRPMHPTGF